MSLQACRHGDVWWVNKMAHSDYMRDLIKYLRLVLTGHDCQFKIIKRKYLTFKLVVTRGKTQVIMLAYCRNKYNVLTTPVIK